jgi:hypothetical protein
MALALPGWIAAQIGKQIEGAAGVLQKVVGDVGVNLG